MPTGSASYEPGSLRSAATGPVLETFFRGLLAVVLFAAFPPFSDIFRVWNRHGGFRAAFEYPPVAQALWAPLSLLHSGAAAVIANGVAMTLVAIVITYLLEGARTERGPADASMWARCPALIFFLPINWDVAAAGLLLAGVLSAEQRRDGRSGVWLGLGAALKVFPVTVLPGMIGAMRNCRRSVVLSGGALATALTVYVGFWLVDPHDWSRHLGFAASRDDFYGTVWVPTSGFLEVFGVHLELSALNTLTLAAAALGLVGVAIWAAVRRPPIAEAAAVAVAVFLLLNKVFKPQYVVWIIPILALVRVRRYLVRVLEVSAIVQLAGVYWAVPTILTAVSATVRVAVLVVIAAELCMRGPSPLEAEDGASRPVGRS